MVTSLTALRTRIQNEYGASAQKTTYQGHPALLVKNVRPTKQDIEDYKCITSEAGTLFVLGLVEVKESMHIKPLPATMQAFANGCAVRGIAIEKAADLKMSRPGSKTRGVVIPDVPSDYREYTLYLPDDYLDHKDLLFRNVTWIQSKNDTHRLKVLIMTRRQHLYTQHQAVNDLLRQIAEIANIPDETELSGWGKWGDIKDEIFSKSGWLKC